MRCLVIQDDQLLLGAAGEECESLADDRADTFAIGLEPARDKAVDVLPAEPTRIDLEEKLIWTVGPASALICPRFQHREPSHELRAERSPGPKEEVVDVLGGTTEASVAGHDLLADHLVRIESME